MSCHKNSVVVASDVNSRDGIGVEIYPGRDRTLLMKFEQADRL